MQRDTFQVKNFPDLTMFQSESKQQVLNVCIATDEIMGPVSKQSA